MMISSYPRTIILFLACSLILSGCGLIAPAPRFPQFDEENITGPGSFWLPQWSNDGQYLAYIDDTNYKMGLVVYDTQTQSHWSVASFVSPIYFDWTPDDRLSYLDYRAELSGAPWPEVFDLHIVDRDGQDDQVVASNLYSPGNFAWFEDGVRLVIRLAESNTRDGKGDIYILDTATGQKELLVTRQQLNIDYPAAIALSPNGKLLLIDGISTDVRESPYIVFDIPNQTIGETFNPRKMIPVTETPNLQPGMAIYLNWGWVGGEQWILASINTPNGDCYNYALFFIDTQNLNNSLCIPTSQGPFAAPTLTPDLSHIAYITVEGPGAYYVMIGELPADIQVKLTNQDQ